MTVAITDLELEKNHDLKTKNPDYDTATSEWSNGSAAIKELEKLFSDSGIEGLPEWLRDRREAVGSLNEQFKEGQALQLTVVRKTRQGEP